MRGRPAGEQLVGEVEVHVGAQGQGHELGQSSHQQLQVVTREPDRTVGQVVGSQLALVADGQRRVALEGRLDRRRRRALLEQGGMGGHRVVEVRRPPADRGAPAFPDDPLDGLAEQLLVHDLRPVCGVPEQLEPTRPEDARRVVRCRSSRSSSRRVHRVSSCRWYAVIRPVSVTNVSRVDLARGQVRLVQQHEHVVDGVELRQPSGQRGVVPAARGSGSSSGRWG